MKRKSNKIPRFYPTKLKNNFYYNLFFSFCHLLLQVIFFANEFLLANYHYKGKLHFATTFFFGFIESPLLLQI